MLKKIIYLALILSMVCSLVVEGLAAGSMTGDQTFANKYVTIDYSQAAQGSVRLRYEKATQKELRVYIYKDSEFDAFRLNNAGQWQTIGLTNGSGTYTFRVYEHAYDHLFFERAKFELKIALSSETAPYLASNQKVDFDKAPKTVALAAQLTAGCTTNRQKIDAIHSYIARNGGYDYNKRNDVLSGNVSFSVYDLDCILEQKTGICGDYAALMCGMLRSQNIPAKMEYGYLSDGKYHAWVSAYDTATGAWVRYDPSTYSVGYQINLPWVMSYVGNDANYRVTETF